LTSSRLSTTASASLNSSGGWEFVTARHFIPARRTPVFQLSEKKTHTVALLKKQERAQTSVTGVCIDPFAELFRLTASMSFVISDLLTRLWFFRWLTFLGRRSLPGAVRIYAHRVLWHGSCF